MFSLIISIIAIALVVILAGASLYYGGDAFNNNGVKGEVARYKNEAQQLSAGLTLYLQEHHGFEDGFGWERLVEEGILKSIPSSVMNEAGDATIVSWGVKENLIILPGVSDAVCVKANEMEGVQTVFGSAPADYQAMPTVGADVYVPICADGLDDSIPCCYDNS